MRSTTAPILALTCWRPRTLSILTSQVIPMKISLLRLQPAHPEALEGRAHTAFRPSKGPDGPDQLFFISGGAAPNRHVPLP